MTTYTWPQNFKPAEFFFRLMPNVRSIDGAFSASQTIEFPGALWRAVLTLPAAYHADRAPMEGWFNRLRGPASRINLWHLARPVPRGTLQSNTTASAPRAQFDATLAFAAANGLTMFAGDMVGVALANGTTQLVQVVQDAVAAGGEITAEITPVLRWSVVYGAAVTVIRPTARFKLLEAPGFQYLPGLAAEIPLEFEEA